MNLGMIMEQTQNTTVPNTISFRYATAAIVVYIFTLTALDNYTAGGVVKMRLKRRKELSIQGLGSVCRSIVIKLLRATE